MAIDLSAELSSVSVDAAVSLQADWLELSAYFSEHGQSLLKELLSEYDLGADYQAEDFASEDEFAESLLVEVCEEVARRSAVLEGAYPFQISDDGFVLNLSNNDSIGHNAYIFALILSHLPSSEIFPSKMAPTVKQTVKARDVFQICATLAVAGKTNGPSYSVGWPRPLKGSFHSKVQEIWGAFGDGVPHAITPPEVPRKIKDGGIDVISWWPEPDGQPGHGWLCGQVASGNDWTNKSIIPDMNAFRNTWFHTQPASNMHGALLMPFILNTLEVRYQTPRHGEIIHRGRLPRLAQIGLQLAAEGQRNVERISDVPQVGAWLTSYRDNLKARLQL